MKNIWLSTILLLIIIECYQTDYIENETDKFICEDGVTRCSKSNTCCPGKIDSYKCCPVENGICCNDGEHCCPANTTCDLKRMTCIATSLVSVPESNVIPSDSKYFIKNTKLAFKTNNVCPDHVHYCSGNDPCCRTPTGIFTCCNYPYGSCCADGLHCCPYGMICIGNITCAKVNVATSISILDTMPSDHLKDKFQSCGNDTYCPNDNTCCQTSNGNWRCCPMQNAVCCSSGHTCCPSLTSCYFGNCV